jgi:hypothetical protein
MRCVFETKLMAYRLYLSGSWERSFGNTQLGVCRVPRLYLMVAERNQFEAHYLLDILLERFLLLAILCVGNEICLNT